ncbi:MAG: hypothetical protein CL878_08980 [Dehalococcoidia bacterium]|nr:hypothetical protein [Dehalococcoidia bacterium]
MDFGSDSVVAGIVRRTSREQVTILGVGRRLLDPVPHLPYALPGGSTLLERSEQAIREAEDVAGEIPQRTIVSLRGELVWGTLETVETTRREPEEPVTEDELAALTDDATARVAPKSRARLRHDGPVGWDAVPLSPVLAESRLDGRRVPSAIGRAGEVLSVALFLGWSPQSLRQTVLDYAEQLDLDVQALYVGAYAAGTGGAILTGGLLEGTIIDVAGSSTEIAIVRRGSVARTRSFALGTAAWTRRVAYHLGCTIDEALRLRRAAAAGSLRGERVRVLRTLAGEDLDMWLAAAEVALTDLSEDSPLPSHVVLTGDTTALPAVRSTLINHQWPATVRFERTISIRVPRNLPSGPVRDLGRSLRVPQDAGLVGLAVQAAAPTGIRLPPAGTTETPAAV